MQIARACCQRSMSKGADKQTALRVATKVLIKVALQRGSHDNITVIAADIALPKQQQQQVTKVAGPAASTAADSADARAGRAALVHSRSVSLPWGMEVGAANALRAEEQQQVGGAQKAPAAAPPPQPLVQAISGPLEIVHHRIQRHGVHLRSAEHLLVSVTSSSDDSEDM